MLACLRSEMITASTKPIERWHHLARQVEAKERLFRFPKATFELAVDNECRPRRRQIKEKRTRRPSAPVQTAPQEEARRGSFQPNWPRPRPAPLFGLKPAEKKAFVPR
jgi:hypothetical protein